MKNQITGFWNKNKVFILGLISAVAISLQQIIETKTADIKVIGFAALIAALTFFAKEWRGQGLSITGVIGNAAGIFISQQQAGVFTWSQFAIQAVVLIITMAMPDPKSRGYENTPAIVAAKKEGEQINPASLTSK